MLNSKELKYLGYTFDGNNLIALNRDLANKLWVEFNHKINLYELKFSKTDKITKDPVKSEVDLEDTLYEHQLFGVELNELNDIQKMFLLEL